ncbi:MAG: hypothetical protein YHS30scaffold667_47 [Phage 65_10]|nr:MAG: hypothetical protein YHS30scaffold667_47 [Phage 65_10]
MTVKYLLHPGTVTSKTDGDRHFIDYRTLARLYDVPLSECEVHPDRAFSRLGWRRPEGAIDLYPQSSGDYTLPTT